MGSFIVEVETDDGTTGVGVSIGGEPGTMICAKYSRSILFFNR